MGDLDITTIPLLQPKFTQLSLFSFFFCKFFSLTEIQKIMCLMRNKTVFSNHDARDFVFKTKGYSYM